MITRFNDFHNKVCVDCALKSELQDLKNKVYLNALTEEEQMDFLETNMLPFAKKLGIDFTMEELRHFIMQEKGVGEFPEEKQFEVANIGISASDVLKHFFRDDDEK